MTDSLFVTAHVSGWLALLAIWVLFAWIYRDYPMDAYRQSLFALHDELLDYAKSGGIAFEHPSYRGLRMHLNGRIRFAHRLSLWWLLSTLALKVLRPTPAIDHALRRQHRQMFDAATRD